MKGTISRENVKSIVALGSAAILAWRTLRRLRPAVVVSVGGYASLPALQAAALLRIPIIVTEQNTVPGAANRFGSRWAKACAVAFAQKKHLLPSPLRLCIVARSQDGLRKTDELVRSATADCSKVELNRYDVDLSDLDTVEGMTDIFQELQSFSFGDGKATETGVMAQDERAATRERY